MRRVPTWRHTVGTKGINRVTVYERRDRSCLYIEWWDRAGRRNQRVVEYVSGLPVPNTSEGREYAVLAAEALSKEREQMIYAGLANVYGVTPPRTVNELLARLEADRGETWSEAYQRDQTRFRTFWEAKLGAFSLTTVNAAVVNRIAKDAARRGKWRPRTHGSYLRYIVDAFGYAEKKLKWIDARDNLSAVDIPAPNSKGEEYTLEEIRKLLPALEAVDIRAGWIGHVAWQTGRRLSAVRLILKRDVLASGGVAVLRFREDTDKVGRESEAKIAGRAAELTEAMLAKPGKYLLGKAPPSVDVCEDWILKAEIAAEIPHRKHRAWHGLKRSFVTAAQDLRLASKQSGTRQSTLATVYDKDWSEGKEGLAKALAELATATADNG